MRLIARRIAAVAAVLLGLACVSAAAIGSGDTPLIGRPKAPEATAATAIAPFNPQAGASRAGPQTELRVPSSFDSEYGKRGRHEVVVTIRGRPNFIINWRDKKQRSGIGSTTWSRTVVGGFPLAQVAVQAILGSGRCTITIDGEVRDTQSTTDERPIAFCEA